VGCSFFLLLLRIFSLALPFKWRVGWGWCLVVSCARRTRGYFVYSGESLSLHHSGEGRDPVPFLSLRLSESLPFRHSGESRNPSAFAFDVWRFAKTNSRPCDVPSAILAAGSLSLLAQRK
jgi:hypothetical protein